MLLTAGRKDIKSEFRVMASALSKEMGMMETQLKRWKEAAHDALSLSEEAQSLKAQLDRKVLSHLPILFLLLLVKLFLCIMRTIWSEQNTLIFEGNDHLPLELKMIELLHYVFFLFLICWTFWTFVTLDHVL